MAFSLLRITKSLKKLNINSRYNIAPQLIKEVENGTSPNQILFGCTSRNTNFFNKLSAQNLWKGVTSVSNAGKKRGRAKTVSKKLIKDLNKGQVIGVGKANIIWPGLSAPILRGKELVQQQQLPPNEEREKKLLQLRDKMGNIKFPKIDPLDRGWSGGRIGGKSIGPPDPVEGESFEGFDTRVIELKTVFNMKGNFGRKRRQAGFVVTGNGKGLAGFASSKGADSRITLRKARNRAGQKLMPIKIFRNHTVYHDFFTQFGKTKIYVSQRPEGHGLICHRAIKTICEVTGIKDLHAKVEGSTNIQHIVKAFFIGLLKQRSHEEIAEEKKLHLVEFCEENNYFPNVLASPVGECRKSKDVKSDEVLDFTQYCLDNRVIYKKKKFPPFYSTYRSYQIHLQKQEKLRNKDKVSINLIAQYGELRSFLADKYPDCLPQKYQKNKESKE